MKRSDNHFPPDPRLRAAAETELVDQPSAGVAGRSAEELLHELRVHQVELEMQNETLREAQSALEESRDLYVDLYDFAPIGYFTLSADGMIVRINLTGARFLGVDRKHLLRRRFANFVSDEDRRRWMRHFVNVNNRTGGSRIELALRREDGAPIQCSLDCEPIPAGVDNGAIRVALSDITERKQAEAELTQYRNELEAQVLARTASLAQARDDAEAASRAKDIFLSTMSHELRTPMQAVMGMTELVMLGITEPRQLDKLGKSQRGARQLLALINDVLDFSSSAADLLTLTEVNFSPRRVLDEIVAAQAEVACAKKLRLVTEIDPAVAGVLRGDRLRFKQILLKFTDNAIKFSVRGQITVRVHCGQQDRLSQWLRLEVSDEGIGISSDQQARLFQAFTQVDGSLTRPYGGAGLGLVLCRRIARLMGGDAGVSSVEGSGSTFWATVQLSLPGETTVSEEVDRLTSARDLLVRDFAGARVLVVEDELAYQELAVLVLESAGLTVAVAGDGQQALDMARQSAYDLILMDVHLPVRDGADAARAIRELPPMAEVPIIAMTSAGFDRARDRSLIAGMNDHVGKPVDFEVLCATVLHWLREKSAVR